MKDQKLLFLFLKKSQCILPRSPVSGLLVGWKWGTGSVKESCQLQLMHSGMLSCMYINTHYLCYTCLIKMQDERRVHRWDPLLTPRQHRGFHSRILQGSLMKKRWNHRRNIYMITCTSFNWKCTHECLLIPLCVFKQPHVVFFTDPYTF